MARKMVIGDIHGALKALEQLLTKPELKKPDLLIFLGDYVDGWSETAGLIEYLIRLEKAQPCIFIKGNHDAWCERWLRGEQPDTDWLRQGGWSTIDSYRHYTPEQKAMHLEFFGRMRKYHVDDANRLFIHAGFSSVHGPAREFYESNYFWDRTLWEMAVTMDKRIKRSSKRYPKRLLLYDEIYIGHTPTLNYDVSTPMQACNVWNVDSGAAFTGRLSALDIETKEFWQSDIVQDLYPGEPGRNK